MESIAIMLMHFSGSHWRLLDFYFGSLMGSSNIGESLL
jgi:hypothetical protein